jgi:hypothetical protein
MLIYMIEVMLLSTVLAWLISKKVLIINKTIHNEGSANDGLPLAVGVLTRLPIAVLPPQTPAAALPSPATPSLQL